MDWQRIENSGNAVWPSSPFSGDISDHDFARIDYLFKRW
jgi:hypothetical protein